MALTPALKHPAGPFTVRISTYSTAPNRVGDPLGQIYSSRHRSPSAAGRRLASIITGKSVLARQCRACITPGQAGRYLIETGDGSRFALKPFRKMFVASKIS